jgi:hypothetical protein
MEEKEVGRITHYFDRARVAVLALKEPLQVGDKVHIKGMKTDLTQVVGSLQLEHEAIQIAKPGMDVAMLVDVPVHEHDHIFKVTE